MKSNRALVLLLLLTGCSPKYTSGKTQCSDKYECPSGYLCVSSGTTSVCVTKDSDCSAAKPCASGSSCWDDGSSSTHYCVDNAITQCSSTSTYYCAQTETCWLSAGACSTVTYCGNAQHPGSVICATAGYLPDCNGDSCFLPDAGAPSPGKDAGTGGSGGDAGRDSASVTPEVAVADVVRDSAGVTPDVLAADASRDSGLGRDSLSSGDGPIACTTAATCGPRQQCLSSQCCTPPAAGGVCSPNPACGCPSGQVCYPSTTSHAMACFTSNYLTEGADCTNGNCQAGLGCFGSICKRYCLADTDCPMVAGVQKCLQTTWSSDSTDIAGIMVCQRVCDPAHPQNPIAPFLACPAGFGCSSSTTGASGCYKTAPLPAGSTCATDDDCSPGYYCTTSGACLKYCLSSADCTTGTTCQFTWSPPEYAGSTMVGYCK